ncbi:MAG: glycosyltransferase family 8 protein [Candidatus Caccosoma sp.]|nr:glycosyltransferase family 8 protein [Candidatus Caccosoma sp.]
MNILVTINKKYLSIFDTMLNSLMNNNKEMLDIYILANDISNDDISNIKVNSNVSLHLIHYVDSKLDLAPTSKRYPSVIYYRLVAANFLPSTVEKILYLDPDLVVLKPLDDLYNLDFDNSLFIGATNVRKFLTKFNESKNRAPKNSPYLNTGVLLINIKELRKFDCSQMIYDYINKNKNVLTLPDQDILQGLFGDRIKLVDQLKYNLSDRSITLNNLKVKNEKIDANWVNANCYIIHFFGRNKPWKDNYRGILKDFYLKYKR